MPRRRRLPRVECECGTVLVLSQHHASDDFLDYVREQDGDLDWELVDQWIEAGTGYLVLHMGANGENLFELIARDRDELLGSVLDRLAREAVDIALIQAGGIGSQETLEVFNTRWVQRGGLPNPQFDPSLVLH